jgi:hypothetical protein
MRVVRFFLLIVLILNQVLLISSFTNSGSIERSSIKLVIATIVSLLFKFISIAFYWGRVNSIIKIGLIILNFPTLLYLLIKLPPSQYKVKN